MTTTVTVVLIDSRRHRKLILPTASNTVIQPVTVNGVPGRVVFRFQGDFFRGDPIYPQTEGMLLPDSWWDALPQTGAQG